MINRHNWSPTFFLSALGAGGMAISFFMYLLFWTPHPKTPIPIYETVLEAFNLGRGSARIMITIAILGITIFSILHFALLLWNLLKYFKWKSEGNINSLKGTNAHTQLLNIPLTLAMTVNVGFVVGAVFVPQLWTMVEYLFPAAMLAFTLIGISALRTYLEFFSHSVSENEFDSSANNSLAQLLPGFAIAMISVGLAAPAAMSHVKITVMVSIILSSIFLIPAIIISAIKLVIGISHMLEHGANRCALPTLWIGVPILTTLSIALLRLDHGLVHTLGANEAGSHFFFLTTVFSAQIFLILLGIAVMKKMSYFRSVWNGEISSPALFALICPGVALSVSVHFFVNKGLLPLQVIEKFGLAYWMLNSFALSIQFITGAFLLTLVTRMFLNKNSPLPV
jgi:hypothetical protein